MISSLRRSRSVQRPFAHGYAAGRVSANFRFQNPLSKPGSKAIGTWKGGRSRRVPSYRTILNRSCGDPYHALISFAQIRASAEIAGIHRPQSGRPSRSRSGITITAVYRQPSLESLAEPHATGVRGPLPPLAAVRRPTAQVWRAPRAPSPLRPSRGRRSRLQSREAVLDQGWSNPGPRGNLTSGRSAPPGADGNAPMFVAQAKCFFLRERPIQAAAATSCEISSDVDPFRDSPAHHPPRSSVAKPPRRFEPIGSVMRSLPSCAAPVRLELRVLVTIPRPAPIFPRL
jgi:hypothetical protein